jgi:hypothetical protein
MSDFISFIFKKGNRNDRQNGKWKINNIDGRDQRPAEDVFDEAVEAPDTDEGILQKVGFQ